VSLLTGEAPFMPQAAERLVASERYQALSLASPEAVDGALRCWALKKEASRLHNLITKLHRRYIVTSV
jgi:hypothetical protein